MASKELIEKVSEAIADADGEDRELYPAYYDALAKAAISTILTALQEPTEGMIKSGAQEVDWYDHNAIDCWRAMLAASPLGEQSE